MQEGLAGDDVMKSKKCRRTHQDSVTIRQLLPGIVDTANAGSLQVDVHHVSHKHYKNQGKLDMHDRHCKLFGGFKLY